jgi:hypothetical protein
MKKSILAMILLAACCTNIQAQEVYKEVLRLSQNVANDKTKDLQTRKVATFKVDALNYMAMKMNEEMPDSTVNVLDREAYNLYDFVNLYIKKLGEVKSKKAKSEIIQLFKNASLQNSRFNDMDLEVTEGYIRAEGYITKFSLDTNWGKAVEQARNELRKLQK